MIGLRWMKGVLCARRKAAASASQSARQKGYVSKAGVVRHSQGMKGWRPSACPLDSKPVRALGEAGEFLPDIGSIGLSSTLGPRAFGAWMRGFPSSHERGSAAARVGRKWRPSVHDHEQGASPSPRSKRPGKLEMKTKETTLKPRPMGAPTRPPGLFQGGKGRTQKRALGGRRNPLIRLDSTKETRAPI
jgi:hypothetical protein